MDGGPNLFDIHFADDILIFARSHQESRQSIDSLVLCLERVGLFLNAKKTVVLINEAQPPPILAAECLSKPLEFLDPSISISKLLK